MRRWAEIFTAVARLLVVLAVALVGGFLHVAQAQAAVLHGGPTAPHAYERSCGAVRFAFAPSDGGPTLLVVQRTARDPLDNQSYRISARRQTTAEHTVYPNLVQFAGIAGSGTTRQEQLRPVGGDPFRARTGVAANSAPTVVFSRSRAPGIAGTFDDAVANGALRLPPNRGGLLYAASGSRTRVVS